MRRGWPSSQALARPRFWLAALVVASAAVRSGLGLMRPTPLYYPDEYLYTAMARSIASTGLPRVRGHVPHFPALLGPYLMAPAWLIHNVDVAYRVALGWGSLWFSMAAVPAFALARRVGVSEGGALLVAMLTILVPDAAYTTDILSEPFAYPLFLTVALVGIRALASPKPSRQVVLLVLMFALCLLRFEFIVVPAAYLVALVVCRRSWRAALREQWIVVSGVSLAAATALAVGLHRLTGYYTRGESAYHFHWGLIGWYGLDLFVLIVAAGWVVAPGATLGAWHLWKGDAQQRAFAVLSVALIAALLAVAAPFGPSQGRLYERYFFYAIPLVTIAFVWGIEALDRGRAYVALAYSAAVIVVVVPAIHDLSVTADDMSPTLLGLSTLGGGGNTATLTWVAILSLASVAVGLRIGRRHLTPLLALAIVAAVGATAVHSLLSYGAVLGAKLGVSNGIPQLQAPTDAALVTSSTTNRFRLMKTLFWNPNVTRVLSIGSASAVDGFAATQVRLVSGRGFVDAAGGTVEGPFAVDSDTFAAAPSMTDPTEARSGVFEQAPALIAFGWNRLDGYLETVSRLYAVATQRPLHIRIALFSSSGTKKMAFKCGRSKDEVVVGARTRWVRLSVRPHAELACRIALVRGTPATEGNRTVSVHARLALLR